MPKSKSRYGSKSTVNKSGASRVSKVDGSTVHDEDVDVLDDEKLSDISEVGVANSRSERLFVRRAFATVLCFAISVIMATIVLPLVGEFVANATNTTAESTVLSMLKVWLLPMVFVTSLLVFGIIQLFKLIWNRASAVDSERPRQKNRFARR